MDRTNAIQIAPDVISPELPAAASDAPHYEVFVAMQKRGEERRLDTELAALIADRAMDFAGLTPREQAAIAWVEAVISSGKTQSSDGAYAALRRHFDAAAIAKLTAIAGTASARTRLRAAKG